jgi:hypothetical protein
VVCLRVRPTNWTRIGFKYIYQPWVESKKYIGTYEIKYIKKIVGPVIFFFIHSELSRLRKNLKAP